MAKPAAWFSSWIFKAGPRSHLRRLRERWHAGSTSWKFIAVDLTKQNIAWTFQTEASKQNLPAFTKPDGSANYYVGFTPDFYDDLMAGYGKLLALGPILASPVVQDHVVYVGSVDGNLYALM
jgi:outer membrane protein assembly factor BamB